MRVLRNWEFVPSVRGGKAALVLLACLLMVSFLTKSKAIYKVGATPTSEQAATKAQAVLQEYCVMCHSGTAPKGGVNIDRLIAQDSIGEGFQKWENIALVLEQQTMPPKAMPQPSEQERAQVASWIRTNLAAYAKKHDGDPGPVTVRRLTSGEYAYAIKDLTGYDLNVGIDSSSDAVGGEGFTNFGDVQFMQDANLERYLSAAKLVADHAVIGAGPLEFFSDPGKTGFEFSAVARIRDIYAANGIRTVSGEGGRPFGLDKYGKALFVAWQYKHRAVLGEAQATFQTLAAREGITARFAQHIWQTMNKPALGYPSSEIAARWRKLPAPPADKNLAAVRAGCDELQKFMVTWPSWLFARGDVAAGGAGDESPLEFSDRTLNVKSPHRFTYVRGGGRPGATQPGPAKIYFNVAPINPAMGDKPVIIWRNLTIGFRPIVPRGQVKAGESVVVLAADAEAAANLRRGILPPGERHTLKSLVNAETAQRLNFGKSLDGTPLGPDDFASEGSVMFEVPMPTDKPMTLNLQVEAELGGNRDQVLRVVISDRADGQTRGQPTRALIGDMNSAGYKAFRAGVQEYASLLPPNTHGEPTPADKDPVPDPFDNTYNVPEHDEFVQKIKYHRDDKFVADNMLDAATRKRLNDAWNDLYASFEYHDNYLRLLAKHYSYDLKGKGIAQMDKAAIDTLPAEMRKYVTPLRHEYDAVMTAQATARPRHLTDCLEFAGRAWRRPLTDSEKLNLRAFYEKTFNAEADHRKAIRAVLTRILVAPQFLYRVETVRNSDVGMREAGGLQAQPVSFNPQSAIRNPQSSLSPLSNWEMASRLSFFLWSSIPDNELRRAANAGELIDQAGIQRQVKRMIADPKARRLSTEFFGQWLGFYHFDKYQGVDTTRFTEFTDDVKEAMYDEAVSFFEYIIRKERPLRELLSADYTFLNKDLAKFYGVTKEIKATEKPELVEGANAFHRGGLLRLGAVLTATSAPLRTSPVKRGDWILRRILGTPVPPPPADAGSLPADDKMFGGLSLKAKLEQHKRNATCANCHYRIDPLGFSLERYDSTGRWRDKYADGNTIEDSAALPDKSEIAGIDGLLKYLHKKDTQVRKTLSYKLVGYALGRTVLASDQLLIERMVQAGDDATFAQLATEIALSKQFRQRYGRTEATAQTSTNKIALNTAAKPQGGRQ
jgi:mono/diheme cytochrome c family protein